MGRENDGIKTIIEMVHGTRLDTAIGSSALMRQALVQVNICSDCDQQPILFISPYYQKMKFVRCV